MELTLPWVEPLDQRAIRDARNRFVTNSAERPDGIRPLVELSWRRSRDRGVDPALQGAPIVLDGDALHFSRRRHAEMLTAARPVIAQALQDLLDAPALIVLTDATGIVLWTEGGAAILDRARSIRLEPGSQWDEAVCGTNGIGTALATGKAVQIVAAEHFFEGGMRWGCSGAVIRDPYDGKCLGVLDISGPSKTHDGRYLAAAIGGARRIEASLALLDMDRRARLLDSALNGKRRRHHAGLAIFDHKGRLIRADPKARAFFASLGPGAPIGRGLTALSGLPEGVSADWLEPVIDRGDRLGSVLVLPPTSTRSLASKPPDPFADLIGESPLLAVAKARARRLSGLRVPMLLLGPTGSGKDVFARALHRSSPRASGPFVPLNCGAATRELLASELFGYADGAFTGARRGGMAGKFEAADGGTLFLDEIGELPIELQPVLLRVLDDNLVYRLGESEPRQVDVRIIAATNRDLRAEVEAGRFRADLFYRLSVAVIQLPALAERKDDLPGLVRHFVDRAARLHGVPPAYPTPALLDVLAAHSWPGNIRELRNAVESMVLLADGHQLCVRDLPAEIGAHACMARAAPGAAGGRLAESERQAIAAAIQAEQGNLTRAAGRLGIAKSTLYAKMRRYGIDRRGNGLQ